MKRMSIWCTCDICNEVIERTDRQYRLGLLLIEPKDLEVKEEVFQPGEPPQETDSLETLQSENYSEIREAMAKVQRYDLCPKCVQLFFNLMNMRREEVEKEKLKVSKMIERKISKRKNNNGTK